MIENLGLTPDLRKKPPLPTCIEDGCDGMIEIIVQEGREIDLVGGICAVSCVCLSDNHLQERVFTTDEVGAIDDAAVQRRLELLDEIDPGQFAYAGKLVCPEGP